MSFTSEMKVLCLSALFAISTLAGCNTDTAERQKQRDDDMKQRVENMGLQYLGPTGSIQLEGYTDAKKGYMVQDNKDSSKYIVYTQGLTILSIVPLKPSTNQTKIGVRSSVF